jgi:hypothetical protein
VLARCTSVRPVRDVSALPAGREVELALTSRGTDTLTPILGPQVVRVRGQLLATAGDTLTLALRRATKENSREEEWQGQSVRFAPGTVASVGERRTDRGRSWLVGVGAVVAALALGLGFARGDGGGGESGGGTTPVN